jgi:hypothetical protein
LILTSIAAVSDAATASMAAARASGARLGLPFGSMSRARRTTSSARLRISRGTSTVTRRAAATSLLDRTAWMKSR